MKGLIALVLSAGVMVNSAVGVFAQSKMEHTNLKKVQVASVDIEEKIMKINKETIERKNGYIDFNRNDMIGNINVKTREEAIKIVADQYNIDESQLTVGKTNDNVYLVNMFDDTEETRIANLFLVVNGKVIDQKFVEADELSDTFVDNYMKYQEVNPIDEYMTNFVLQNQDKDEKLAAQGIANMISFKNGCSIDDVDVKRISEDTFLCDYRTQNGMHSVMVKNGAMVIENESVIAKL